MNIFFSSCHFHNVSKEYFWSKKFQISCTDSKVPFWQFFNFSRQCVIPNGPHGHLEQVHLMLERQVLAWGSFPKVGFYGKIWLKNYFYFKIKHLFKTIKVKLIFGQNFDIWAIVYCCYRQPNWNTGNLLGNTLEALNFLKIGLYF